MKKKILLLSLAVLILIVVIVAVMTHAGCGGDPAQPDNRVLKLTIEGDSPISFTLDLGKGTAAKEGHTLVFSDVITDFTLPFGKLNTDLTAEKLGGDIAVNRVEITGRKNQSAVVCRISKKGTGGGMGNIGGSVVVIFNLDKNILSGGGVIRQLPASGKLADSDTAFNREADIVREDLAAVGATSKKYTALISNKGNGTLFLGFVVFDPTNPESIGSAYFEFSIFESPYPWTLTEEQ